MIEFCEFVKLIFERDNRIDIKNELKSKIISVAQKYRIDVDEKRCLQWIEQAMEIESYTEKEIKDLGIKQLLKRKDDKITELTAENQMLKDKIGMIRDYL